MRLTRVVLLMSAAGVALSQIAAPVPTTFEVASLKASGPRSQRGSSGGPGTTDPGRYTFNSATLDDLIAIAYQVDYFQISSKMTLDQDRFDFTAKVPEGATRQQFRVMLQNLLAERFHLKSHLETKEFPGYELIVGKGGPKLNGAIPKGGSSTDDFPALPPGRPGLSSRHTIKDGLLVVRMTGRQQSMKDIAESLQPPDSQPVVDKTGLAGKYDFSLEYAYDRPNQPPDTAAAPTVIPDLFTALQQQLGLQLVRKKVPFDVVVVESVDRLPTEN
jgi:uncharacterized protein (TIGR03435 family)